MAKRKEHHHEHDHRAAPGQERAGRIDAWWRAANYLSVGQIYLMDNPLLREPLLPEHVKPRLLGHWGTTPGLNFVYAHLNRAITARDLEHDVRHRPGPRRSRSGGVRLAGGDLQRGLPRHEQRRGGHAAAVQAVLLPRRHPEPRRSRDARVHPRGWRARATRSRTRTAPRSTTPTSSWPRSSVTGRPRPGRWPRAGTPRSSSTRVATVRCCRSCTSTVTRSPIRPCWRASPRTSCSACCAATATRRTSWQGDDPA